LRNQNHEKINKSDIASATDFPVELSSIIFFLESEPSGDDLHTKTENEQITGSLNFIGSLTNKINIHDGKHTFQGTASAFCMEVDEIENRGTTQE